MKPISRWRIVAAAVVLAALAFFAALFAPIYYRNLQLQKFVGSLPQRLESASTDGPEPPDDVVRAWVVDRARDLKLPVQNGDIRILRAPGTGRVQRIDVHYMVRVDFPGYTVNLHFYPGAGSR